MFRYILIALILVVSGCSTESKKVDNKEYPRWIGDISYNPDLDDSDFELCYGDSNVMQYFNFSQGLQYMGEKIAIEKEFRSKYKPVETSDSGLLRIRFIVNCKGETDRFRVISMDSNFEQKEFDPRVTSQLLRITKKLNGWKVMPNVAEARDYYQYLIFKIEEGNILEILP